MAEPIHTRRLPKRGDPWIAAVSRSHGDSRTEAFIASRPGAIRQVLGSAVKFGRVAEGGADIYPRLAPTCEWDIAAGHAIVTAAGGKITDAARRRAALREGRRPKDNEVLSCRNSLPGAIPRRRANEDSSPRIRQLLRQVLLQLAASAGSPPQQRCGSAAKASRLCSRPNR